MAPSVSGEIGHRYRRLRRLRRREVEGFHDAGKRQFGSLVNFPNTSGIGRFKETHAVSLTRHERAADIANGFALVCERLARVDGGALSASELIEGHSGQITVNQKYRHGGL